MKSLWKNETSGNRGTAVLQTLEEQDGLPCRVVVHTVTIGKTGKTGSMTSRICQKSGRWLLAPKE